jgi:hypothetical protein
MDFNETEKRWLADMCEDITRQHIFNWEKGGGISLKYLPMVAKVKGITVDELVRQLNEDESHTKEG